jgi:hypothetical protein
MPPILSSTISVRILSAAARSGTLHATRSTNGKARPPRRIFLQKLHSFWKESTMPLKKGSSQATISANIGEMLDQAKHGGKIGNYKPPSMAKARQVAAAIAYRKAGKARSGKK